jgi:FkbM family methyltransferase
MADFESLVREALALEGQRRSAAAIERYRDAAAARPGHGLPFTKLSVLAARRIWGPPPPPRPPLPAGAACVTMSALGQIGRFGNQILQYGYLRLYAEASGAAFECGDWVGRDLFALDDPLVSRSLPRLQDDAFDAAAAIAPGARPRGDVDLQGYFFLPTSAYADRRDRFRSWFELSGMARPVIDAAFEKLRMAGRTVVALHLRRGDFGYGWFWLAPPAWYRDWLASIWPKLEAPLLYIASDDPGSLAGFAEYRPIGGASLAQLPPDLAFLVDFFVLSRADRVATANSSFSFVAALLNRRARHFVRPDPAAGRLVPFDPWNARPLLDPPWFGRSAVTAAETTVIAKFIAKGATVFDVGANRGEWSQQVLNHCQGEARVFAFEPNPVSFSELSAWVEMSRPGSITPIEAAAAGAPGFRPFQVYDWQDEFSGFYRRTHPVFDGRPPRTIEVRALTLDDFCRERGVRNVNFLKLDVEGAELEVLTGCRRLLAQARIDFIQFEYGGTFRDSGTRLADVFRLLQDQGYRLFKLGGELVHVPQWSDALEDWQYANFLAIHGRLAPHCLAAV